jgi:hypothetical protein
MYDYHVLLGIFGSFIGIVGVVWYITTIFQGRTKPHVFTWFTFALLDAIVFAAQQTRGAGAGSWIIGLAAASCFLIAVLALFRGERRITPSDWVAFTGALLAIVLWVATNDPLLAVVISTIINLLGDYPTFRKSYYEPWRESMSAWSLDVVKFLLSVAALQSFNLTTVLFPLSVAIVNAGFVTMVLIRRSRVPKGEI